MATPQPGEPSRSPAGDARRERIAHNTHAAPPRTPARGHGTHRCTVHVSYPAHSDPRGRHTPVSPTRLTDTHHATASEKGRQRDGSTPPRQPPTANRAHTPLTPAGIAHHPPRRRQRSHLTLSTRRLLSAECFELEPMHELMRPRPDPSRDLARPHPVDHLVKIRTAARRGPAHPVCLRALPVGPYLVAAAVAVG